MHVHSQLKPFLATTFGEAAFNVCEQIQAAGFSVYMAGGSVRDLLLDLPIVDIDLATSALPKDLEKILQVKSNHAEDLGSVVAVHKGFEFEITTFRNESTEATGRKPNKITFGTIEDDVYRRDFTVNALYADIVSGEVIDMVNGVSDLNERIVRTIGEASVRFVEDPLRMLRAVRLRGTLDGQYHPSTYRALKNTAIRVNVLAPVLLWKEFEKVLQNLHPELILEDLWELQLLQQFLPELSDLKGIAQPHKFHEEGDVWNHTLGVVKAFESHHSLDVRVAAVFHDVGKAQTFSISNDRIHFNDHASASKDLLRAIGKRFLLPNKRLQKLAFLVGHHMMMQDLLDMNEERKAHWYYHEWFTELLELFYLDIAGTEPSNFELYNAVYKDYLAYIDAHPKKPTPLLTGQVIMDTLHIPPSPLVQTVKDDLETLQLQKKLTTKKEAIDYLIEHKDTYTNATRQ